MFEFHFLRPYWLLVLVALLPATYIYLRNSGTSNQWKRYIQAELLKHLQLQNNSAKRTHWLLYSVISAFILSSLALAGPTWEKRPSPTTEGLSSLVIVLDQSLSMLAEDTPPSRNELAKRKVQDIIKLNRYKQIGLVVYAGTANTVVPLTDDHVTLKSFLPALSPIIMPSLGSKADQGIRLATELLKNIQASDARILLITDGISPNVERNIQTQASKIPMSILVIGTETGAPIPVPEQGYLKDKSGEIIIANTDMSPFSKLSNLSNFRVDKLTHTDNDIQYLLPPPLNLNQDLIHAENEYDTWVEYGYYLVFPLLLLCLLFFRQGIVLTVKTSLVISFFIIYSSSNTAQADQEHTDSTSATNYFLNNDQRAHQQYKAGDFASAKDKFTNPSWQGLSALQAKQYKEAISLLEPLNNAADQYNLGLAYTGANQLQNAIEAFKHALALDPALTQAQKNIEVLENYLNQQANEEHTDNSNADSNSNQDGSEANESQTSSNDEQKGNPEENQSNSDSMNTSEETEESQSQAQQSNEENNEGKGDKTESSQHSPNTESQADENETSEQSHSLSEEKVAQANKEKVEAIQKQLRDIDEDPATLLRNKFQYQYNRNREQYKADEQIW